MSVDWASNDPLLVALGLFCTAAGLHFAFVVGLLPVMAVGAMVRAFLWSPSHGS